MFNHFEEMIMSEVNLNSNAVFEISIELHNIGNYGYYIVKIYDNDAGVFEKNEIKTKISSTYIDILPKKLSKANDLDLDLINNKTTRRLATILNSSNRNLISTNTTNSSLTLNMTNKKLLLHQNSIGYKESQKKSISQQNKHNNLKNSFL